MIDFSSVEMEGRMTGDTQASGKGMAPTNLCWIVRSPDGEYTLKDEDNNAVMVFTDKMLASAFATEEVGAGSFKLEEWLWLKLALHMRAEGFAGAVIDHKRGNEYKNLAVFAGTS